MPGARGSKIFLDENAADAKSVSLKKIEEHRTPLILTNHIKLRGVRQVWSEALQNSRSLPKVSEDAYLLSPASIGILGAESIDGTTTLKLIR